MRRGLLLLSALAIAGCGERQEERNMSANEVAQTLAGVTIEPGLWEIRSEITDVAGPNLPVEARARMIGPRATRRNCITPEQAARPNASFLAARGDESCAYQDFAMRAGRMSGTMRCTEAGVGETLARMSGDYRPDGYELRMTIETPLPDGARMQLQTRTTGRRIGECGAGN